MPRRLPPKRRTPMVRLTVRETQLGVQRIIRLAPILGRCHPEAVPLVVKLIRQLIGNPSDDGGSEVSRAA